MDIYKKLDITKFDELNMPPRVLLGPGPSMVDPRVLRVMATPLVGYMDPLFLNLMSQIQELMRVVFITTNRLTIPISGTGSAAMETALANMIEPGEPVLSCAAGYFGLRMAEIATRVGGTVTTITKPWGEVFRPEEVATALRQHPARVVTIVHGETSSGAMQPVDEIARIVHSAGALLIVDTVASLGGAPFYVASWDIDVCYTGSQKCLSCPPGLGPITIGQRGEEKLRNRKTPVPSWYLDLTLVRRYWEDHVYHHTAPATNYYALYEALRLMLREGIENTWARHLSCANLLWDGLESLGLKCHVPRSNRLPSLTTVRVPEGVDEAAVRKQLLDKYNIDIAGGLGELKGKVWRVGLMGYSARPENVLLLIEALRRELKK